MIIFKLIVHYGLIYIKSKCKGPPYIFFFPRCAVHPEHEQFVYDRVLNSHVWHLSLRLRCQGWLAMLYSPFGLWLVAFEPMRYAFRVKQFIYNGKHFVYKKSSCAEIWLDMMPVSCCGCPFAISGQPQDILNRKASPFYSLFYALSPRCAVHPKHEQFVYVNSCQQLSKAVNSCQQLSTAVNSCKHL